MLESGIDPKAMRAFEIALLRGDAHALEPHRCPAAIALVKGDFAPALQLSPALSALQSTNTDTTQHSPLEHYISGVACLLVFVRENWAGPRLLASNSDRSESIEDAVNVHRLSRDGEDIALSLRNSNFLIAARALLVEQLPRLISAGATLAPWWATRVVLAHHACMSVPTPSIQSELFALFARFLGPSAARTRFLFADAVPMKRQRVNDSADDDDDELFPDMGDCVDEEDEQRCVLPSTASEGAEVGVTSLAVLAHVELALAQRSFYDPDGASETIQRAAEIARIEVSVAGELGTRTKYQQKPTAQLVARAYQLLDAGADTAQRQVLTGLAYVFPRDDSDESGIANQLPLPTNVPVNDSDALGYIKLVDENRAGKDNEDGVADEGVHELGPAIEELTPVDQVVVLALAAIVRARNADHLLTYQQMAPYVNLVLKNENSVFGTSSLTQMKALVERVSFESDRGRYLERCMSQMETVAKFIDDDMQSASKEVRDAAIAERSFLTFAAGIPPHWELKKQLAMSLGKIGLVKAAMEIFKELEFWDELVDCHRLIGNIGAANDLVTSQLKALDDAVSSASAAMRNADNLDAARARKERAVMARAARRPRLLCVLGDVTRDIKYFELAWSESGQRYTRSKRALGRFYMDGKQWAKAVEHFKIALSINPLFPDVWFSYGCASLEINDFRTAAEAFTHVIRQTPDFAEGWNNLARSLVDLGRKKEALKALCESARLMRDSWRIWDNVLTLATELHSTLDSLRALERLLTIRGREAVIARPLCRVVEDVIRLARSSNKDERAEAGVLCRRLLKVLGQATTIVSTNASVWEAYSELHALVPQAGGAQKAFDCRLKQVRVLVGEGEWNRTKLAFRQMVVASITLSELAMQVAERTVLRSAELHMQSIIEQTKADFKDDVGFERIQETMSHLKKSSQPQVLS